MASDGLLPPVKEIDKSATLAWGPVADASGGALLALGSKGESVGFDDSGTELEIHKVDFTSPGGGANKPLGMVKTPGTFVSIAWSAMHSKAAEFPLGIVAGGMADGTVNLWDASKLVASHPQPHVAAIARHAGAVNGLQFNPHRESSHLLASGGADNEVHSMPAPFTSFS